MVYSYTSLHGTGWTDLFNSLSFCGVCWVFKLSHSCCNYHMIDRMPWVDKPWHINFHPPGIFKSQWSIAFRRDKRRFIIIEETAHTSPAFIIDYRDGNRTGAELSFRGISRSVVQSALLKINFFPCRIFTKNNSFFTFFRIVANYAISNFKSLKAWTESHMIVLAIQASYLMHTRSSFLGVKTTRTWIWILISV